MDRTEREKMILDHLYLVKIIALKIFARVPAYFELNDLIQAGILGLIAAVDRFESERGVKFATYASVRIRGAILDELRQQDWASRAVREKIKTLDTAFALLEEKLGRSPTEAEVAAQLQISQDKLNELFSYARPAGIGVFKIDLEKEANLATQAFLFSVDEESPLVRLEKEQLKKILVNFICSLSRQEQIVLSLYYVEDLNLKEIAEVLKVSESRVSQIRTAAILRLRAKFKLMLQARDFSLHHLS